MNPKIETAPLASDLNVKAVVQKPVWNGYAAEHEPMAQGLLQIAARAKDFDPDSFMNNAKHAHEQILEAFAKGDLGALKMLLTPEIYPSFENEVTRRQSQGETAFFKFVGISKAQLIAARMSGATAALDVRFVSQVFSAVKDKAGKILVGDDKLLRTIKELWTFECDLGAADKVWKLAETEDAA